MALVMLPCDLPWWSQVQTHLIKLQNTRNSIELIEIMQKIHDLCNISLDPEEDIPDPNLFVGFLNFLDNELTSEERINFFNHTLKSLVTRALNLKQWKPRGGLHFSLQQQPDCVELDYNFVSSLIANAFFSTFPKRTHKSHPTLQNFNFTILFKTLYDGSWQKAKLRSILHFFDWLDRDDNSSGSLKILRQVMSSKEWLTIEDWLECSLPLCSVQIKHESRLERADWNSLHICFSSPKLGGNVLTNGSSQECINFTTFPELLSVLLNVEALEDNEVVTIERVRQISRINDPKNRAAFEKLETAETVSICCVDAEDYTKLPIGQYEEDNILRELNKCLLAYQQKQTQTNEIKQYPQQPTNKLRRLSPIGESVSSTPPETLNIPIITQESCSTNRSSTDSLSADNNNFLSDKLKNELQKDRSLQKSTSRAGMLNNRRGRFIVLGSSGEHLPVTRQAQESGSSRFSSCESSDDEFHSAKTSLDDGSGDEETRKKYNSDLETKETRRAFAQRLKDALRREAQQSTSSSSDSNYAVGISVTGSGIEDQNIKLRRGGSRGFVLQEESLDEDFLKDSLSRERQWIDKFRNKQSGLSKKESSRSSDYSFSTEYSSELEEVYQQFSQWLEDPILETDKGTKKKLDGRDLAVVQFAGSLLKRTLSESFAGVPVPLTEACSTGRDDDFKTNPKNKLVLNAKSLSLELAKHKHKLAAQLINATKQALDDSSSSSSSSSSPPPPSQSVNKKIKNNKNWTVYIVTSIVQTLEDVCVNIAKPHSELSQIAQRPSTGLKPISTGNWGCGSSRAGDVQLKVIIQWLAASVAGVPLLIYYTAGHQDLVKFDTVVRILIDRKWCVKDLTQAALRYASHVINGQDDVAMTLFDDIIGM